MNQILGFGFIFGFDDLVIHCGTILKLDFRTCGKVFEQFGFNYIGPIDGHDLSALVGTLENISPDSLILANGLDATNVEPVLTLVMISRDWRKREAAFKNPKRPYPYWNEPFEVKAEPVAKPSLFFRFYDRP